MASSLKLLAMDPDDLIVISAHVQDSVLRSCEIEFDPARKLLFLPINRFAWESPGARKRIFKSYERRRSVLHFSQIRSIRSNNIDRGDETQVKCVLSIEFQPSVVEGDPGGAIQINFAGGGGLQLDVECIEAQLTDMGAAWSASSKPKHAR